MVKPSAPTLPLLLAVLAVVACGRQSGPGAPPPPAEPERLEYALAIHGGAGVIARTMEVAEQQKYFDELRAALEAGRDQLAAGGASLDVVEAVVRRLEDSPLFNAGKGAVFTHDGGHELDAAIMDGRDLACGSVAGLRTVKNPITLARRVMESSPHVFMVGEGAERFAELMAVERVDQKYFFTERRYQQWQEALAKEAAEAAAPKDKHGTVGAVALDRKGNLAAATSTGGTTNKRFGRVGDVPIIGAGTYADNRSCAISATGLGEQFIRHTVARSIAARVELSGMSIEEAAKAVIGELDPGDGGVIVVDRWGRTALVYNSEGMFRGQTDSTGRVEVRIWE